MNPETMSGVGSDAGNQLASDADIGEDGEASKQQHHLATTPPQAPPSMMPPTTTEGGADMEESTEAHAPKQAFVAVESSPAAVAAAAVTVAATDDDAQAPAKRAKHGKKENPRKNKQEAPKPLIAELPEAGGVKGGTTQRTTRQGC